MIAATALTPGVPLSSGSQFSGPGVIVAIALAALALVLFVKLLRSRVGRWTLGIGALVLVLAFAALLLLPSFRAPDTASWSAAQSPRAPLPPLPPRPWVNARDRVHETLNGAHARAERAQAEARRAGEHARWESRTKVDEETVLLSRELHRVREHGRDTWRDEAGVVVAQIASDSAAVREAARSLPNEVWTELRTELGRDQTSKLAAEIAAELRDELRDAPPWARNTVEQALARLGPFVDRLYQHGIITLHLDPPDPAAPDTTHMSVVLAPNGAQRAFEVASTEFRQWSRPRLGQWAGFAASLLVFGVLLYLAYLFLDTSTRGQFNRGLRTVAALAFVGICCALWYFVM